MQHDLVTVPGIGPLLGPGTGTGTETGTGPELELVLESVQGLAGEKFQRVLVPLEMV